MQMRKWKVAFVIACASVVLAGCGRRNGDDPFPIDDTLTPEGMEMRMGDRWEDGVRVTDAVFENVQFGYDQYQIDPGEAYKIESVAGYMQRNPRTRLIVEGHCDERGSRDYNAALGEHRAQAVRAYLISLGIDGARIQTRSYGEERPLDPGHSESAWRLNRRGEFLLFR